jgi:predicted O-methyltransferase YrrM
MGARNAIEVGVFTGYSALVVAGAAAGSRLAACDISENTLARPFWRQAGVADKISLRSLPPSRR